VVPEQPSGLGGHVACGSHEHGGVGAQQQIAACGYTGQSRLELAYVAGVVLDQDFGVGVQVGPHPEAVSCLPTEWSEPPGQREAGSDSQPSIVATRAHGFTISLLFVAELVPIARPIDPKADWREWSEILADAGLAHLGTHAMRHSAATIALEEGIALAVVQELLGHSDIRVTRGYTHVSSPLAQDAAARLGRALFAKTATRTATRSHDH